jgi:hypothetical protein
MSGETTLYSPNLYKGTVWTAGGNNKVLYIGMQEPVYSYTMFDVQAIWGLHYITGKIHLPEKNEMEKNIDLWTERYIRLLVPKGKANIGSKILKLATRTMTIILNEVYTRCKN